MATALHLIWGPTSVGKTGASIDLALRTGAPVIALDRIQCCPELATGSGRPSLDELAGTCRIYLANRRLRDGMVCAAEANELLKQQVAECAATSPQVILEGGSVSLLQEMAADPHWAGGFRWSFDRFQLNDAVAFFIGAKRRVRDMLHPRDGCPSLLEELALAWPDPAVHPVLEDVDGYREAIAFARRHALPVSDLPDLPVSLEEELVGEIATEYLRHAAWQESQFPAIPACWMAGDAESADRAVHEHVHVSLLGRVKAALWGPWPH